MLPRDVQPLPHHVYPVDDWCLRETRFPDEHVARAETFLALSNGYLGVRGTFEEGRPGLSPGTFINGFHETWPIRHAEEAYGLARTGQTMVNVPDATVLRLYVDDEPLFLPVARLEEYERCLDLHTGTLTRHLVWSTPAGRHVDVRSSRLVSFDSRHLLAMQYRVELLDQSAPVVVSSQVVNRQDLSLADDPDAIRDPRRAPMFEQRVLHAEVAEHDDHRLELGYRTANSAMSLGVVVDHVVETDNRAHSAVVLDEDHGRLDVVVDARPGVPITITKFVAYHTSRSAPPGQVVARGRLTVERARRTGFDGVADAHHREVARFWERADVRVEGGEGADERLQQAVRWNLFQLGQATWRVEGAGVPAKGLTGQAYEGHYFWDGEMYVSPFLAYTRPRIARNLLRFRHSMLQRARERARTMSEEGALFPWRTINGEEASAYYQAGTAQYHINAAVAWAIRKYVDVRGDVTFLGEVGAEMLVETARLWSSLGFRGADGSFHIHGVTGPDEYTTVVNDNTYTNLMARLNLNAAAAAVRRLAADAPDVHDALVADVGLVDGEVEGWERAAADMYVPYDQDRGIHPQDESFLDREVWDLAATPPEQFPLLLHHHPLVIYRYQVIKQADIVLAMFLLGNEFTEEQKRRNFEYYDPLTTGDSSLSAAIQSIVADQIGDRERASEYFHYALMMDLGDVAGNMSDGVHIASAGGVWMALVFGFGGVRDFDGELCIDPQLPPSMRELEFPIRFRDRQLRVRLTHDEERYLIETGDPLALNVRGVRRVLHAGDALTLPAPTAT